MHSIKKFSASFKEDIGLYVLLAFGFLLRLFYIFIFTAPESYVPLDDGYDQRALQIAEGKWQFASTYWPPFTHLVLSLIYRPLIWLGIIGWRTKIDVIIFAFLYIIGFWCIYQITKKLFPASTQGGSKKIALIVLAVLIFWYPLIFMNYVIFSENIFFPFFFLGLYILIIKPQKALSGLWAGFFWGLAFITRPIFALVFPLFLAWALYYKINWKFLANFFLAVSLVTGSMMLFNFYYTHGGEKSISSNGGVNFAMLWCDAKSIQYNSNANWFFFEPPANVAYPESKRIYTNQPFENQAYYYKMGLDCLKNRPQRLYENFSSVMKLFNSSLIPIIKNVTGWETLRLFFKLLTGLLFTISCFAIIFLILGRTKINQNYKKYFYLFGLIILSLLAAAYSMGVGEERYIVPLAPLLMILSLPIIFAVLDPQIIIKKIHDDRWIWCGYLIFFVFISFVSLLYHISAKESFLVNTDGSKTKIVLPFQRDQFDSKNLEYEVMVTSNINQSAIVNIVVDDAINNITINGKTMNLDIVKKANDTALLNNWKRGFLFELPLKSGKNIIHIYGENYGGGYTLKFKQKPFFWIWILLLVAIGLPLAQLFITVVKSIYPKNNFNGNI